MTAPRRSTVVAATLAAGLLALTGCSSAEPGAGSSSAAAESTDPGTVTITDNHGEIEVPYQPERVVALDNHVLQTLSDWDIELVAAAKGLMAPASGRSTRTTTRSWTSAPTASPTWSRSSPPSRT